MDLIFTDLDGTLLDQDTYSWKAARPALHRLRRRSVPWVLVTSKTRAEAELWRHRLGNEHPFIVENGGAAFIPAGYFPVRNPEARYRGSYELLEWGTPYEELLADLRTASQASRCRIRAFHEMPPEEVSVLCRLPLEQAVLAKQREYDEPFLVRDPDRAGALVAAIEEQGRRWTRGGRFWHILGSNDKALAVEALRALFERVYPSMRTIGLGDGWNDVSFLNVVDAPVLIRSPHSRELKARVPRGWLTERSGPAGWNDAVLALIQ
jgi:mannosyl-3-phosphoglycerate phosphatase